MIAGCCVAAEVEVCAQGSKSVNIHLSGGYFQRCSYVCGVQDREVREPSEQTSS